MYEPKHTTVNTIMKLNVDLPEHTKKGHRRLLNMLDPLLLFLLKIALQSVKTTFLQKIRFSKGPHPV